MSRNPCRNPGEPVQKKQSLADILQAIEDWQSLPDYMKKKMQDELNATLSSLDSSLADKIDAFAQFVRLTQGEIENIKNESNYLKNKYTSKQNALDFLKARYLSIMQAHGQTKLAGNIYSLSIRNYDKVIAPTSDIELAKLCDNFPGLVREETTFKPDKKEIAKAIKAGQSIPGCEIVSSPALMIR